VDGFGGSNNPTSSLPAGASTIVSRTLYAIPQEGTGIRTARAIADYLGQITESNEGNNILTQTFTLP
jgi:hypothetical protein